MDYANVLAILEKDAAKWAESKSLPIALEDRPFTETDNVKVFLKHSVLFGNGEATALGGNCFRFVGVQYMSVMYRPGEGLASLYKYTDSISERYSQVDIDKIVFGSTGLVKVPADSKGLAQLQVVCPFYFDFVRS